MSKFIRSACVMLYFILFVNCTNGQQDSSVVRDFESWSSIAFRTRLLEDKLELKLGQDLRFNENSTALGLLFTEVGASYEVIENLELGGAYRYIYERDEKSGANQWRMQADIGYSNKLNRFKLSYRLRYQLRNYFKNSAGKGDYATSKFRLACKVDYNIKNWKLDPYVKAELFHTSTTEDAIQYLDEVETGTIELSGLEKVRITLGTSFKPFKKAKIGLYYRVERGFNTFPTYLGTSTFNPETIYIFGVNLSYKLNLTSDE